MTAVVLIHYETVVGKDPLFTLVFLGVMSASKSLCFIWPCQKIYKKGCLYLEKITRYRLSSVAPLY